MNQTAQKFYQSKKNHFGEELQAVKKKINLFGWYRIIAFVLIFSPLILLGWDGWYTVIPGIIILIVFLWLVKMNIALEKQKRKLEVLLDFIQKELLALEHHFNHFDNGEYFLDTSHNNSYDLDLFGEGSVFQFLNRTSTQSGRQKLAAWLRSPFLQKEEIEQRQEAVNELSGLPEWRLHFLANGQLFQESSEMNEEITNWGDTELTLNKHGIIRILIFILPLLTITTAGMALSGMTNLPFIAAVLTQWTILFVLRKEVTEFYVMFGRKSELLGKYIHLLQYIESDNFNAQFLKKLQKKVNDPVLASHTFSQLKKLVNQLEFRQNIVINLVFNSILLWDIRCIYNLWNWHRNNRKKLAVRLGVIAEADALISLANCAYNNPTFIYPTIHEGGFSLQAIQIGHPLIPEYKRVNNDLEINGWGKTLIITGANMAGKSTFLRTIGVNLIIGRTGAPVCAERLIFSPVKIYTNMRTTDSLLKDESYFFAELKRIKSVLERLEKGERMLVILDEMLKGTNSVDKLNGSRELIRKLLALKAVALIATHDLKISEMEDEFPQIIFNKCFEIKLEKDEMIFDYQLKDGITKTMNATLLMKQMGII